MKYTIENLKQGDTFYKVEIDKITKYEYLMLYPFHNPINVKANGYHIILDKNFDEPKRIYYTHLQKILDQSVTTFEEAKALRINLIEKHLEYLRKDNE